MLQLRNIKCSMDNDAIHDINNNQVLFNVSSNNAETFLPKNLLIGTSIYTKYDVVFVNNSG